jgi:hypothetical protein
VVALPYSPRSFASQPGKSGMGLLLRSLRALSGVVARSSGLDDQCDSVSRHPADALCQADRDLA